MFVIPLIKYFFKKKLSPFAIGRSLGKKFAKSTIKGYVERRQKVEDEKQREAI